MKLSIKAGSTSQTVNIFIRDSSSTTGGGLTGLVYNSASLVAYYALPKAASVSITLATLAAVTSAYSSGGFKEIDSTNMPGWYRFDIPDAALASGRFVSLHFKGATNMAPTPVEIELTGIDNQDATAFGVSRIDAAVTTRMATFTLPTNFSSLVIDGSGRIDLSKWLGSAPNVLVSGRVDSSVGAMATDVLTSTALAASASTEIASAVCDESLTGHTTAGTLGKTISDINSKTTNLPGSPAAVGSAMTLDLTQAVPTSNTAQTVGDALNAARAQGFGKWVITGTTLNLYANDGSTVVRSFTLDSGSTPTSRT